MRHGESKGNVDGAAYGKTPDAKVPLTSRGEEQARAAGRELNELFGGEHVS